ncbi:MAG: putative ABC transporter permease [Lachnospiraceae bacterium]|nr:putative ABC transporter permease [Lachnospiraceae bacterium]
MTEVLWLFMIYSLLGWGIEVVYHAVTLGAVVNRGFLNGPVCPVYGCGVICVLGVIKKAGESMGYSGNIETASPAVLFVVGITFATAVELIAGAALDKLFHARWWDYSREKFNYKGYICLRFSIIWGLIIAFVLRVIHPGIQSIVGLIPAGIGLIVLIIIYIVFVTDIILTTLAVLKLNKQLDALDELQKSILLISEGMSEVIGTGTIKTVEKLETGKEIAKGEYEQKKQKLEELLAHIEKSIMYNKMFGIGRLFRAFPDMKHSKYQDIIDQIKNMIKEAVKNS